MELTKVDIASEITERLVRVKNPSPEQVRNAVEIAFNIVNDVKCDDCGAKIAKGVEFSNRKEYDERRAALICEDCLVKALGMLRSNQ